MEEWGAMEKTKGGSCVCGFWIGIVLYLTVTHILWTDGERLESEALSGPDKGGILALEPSVFPEKFSQSLASNGITPSCGFQDGTVTPAKQPISYNNASTAKLSIHCDKGASCVSLNAQEYFPIPVNTGTTIYSLNLQTFMKFFIAVLEMLKFCWQIQPEDYVKKVLFLSPFRLSSAIQQIFGHLFKAQKIDLAKASIFMKYLACL